MVCSLGILEAVLVALLWAPRSIPAALGLATAGAVVSMVGHDSYATVIGVLTLAFATGYYRRLPQALYLTVLLAAWATVFGIERPASVRILAATAVPAFLVLMAIGYHLGRSADAEAALALLRDRRAEERARERLELAQELHHGVVRTLSLAKMNAALLAETRGIEELRDIEALCGESLEDLRRLMGALTTHIDDALDLTGGSRDAQDARDVAHACAARLRGLGHEVAVTTPPHPITGATAHTVARVIEEGTSNIAHHSTPPSRCALSLTRMERGLRILIINMKPPVPTHTSTGLGLPALAERVTVLGGTLTAGPTQDGRWVLDVYIPTVTALVAGAPDSPLPTCTEYDMSPLDERVESQTSNAPCGRKDTPVQPGRRHES